MSDHDSPSFQSVPQRRRPLGGTRMDGPRGLGGWLVLVGLGLLLSPLFILASLIQFYVLLFTDGSWAILTTPGSEAYHPTLGPLLISELVVNCAFLVAQIWLLVLFYKCSRGFPKLFIWVALLRLLFVLVDAWVASSVLSEGRIDADTTRDIVRSAVPVVIWVPYMLVSRRVKNTFVA
jgi:hypothetical protein